MRNQVPKISNLKKEYRSVECHCCRINIKENVEIWKLNFYILPKLIIIWYVSISIDNILRDVNSNSISITFSWQFQCITFQINVQIG